MKDRQPGARLLGRTGEFAGLTHNFGIEASVGRSAGNDVVLNSPYLSGRHARIFFKDGDYFIEDLGSRNGTRVDGVAVTRPVCLERVHVITLADAVDLVWIRTSGVTAAPQQPAATTPQPVAVPPPPPVVEPPAAKPAGAGAAAGGPEESDPFATRPTLAETPGPTQPAPVAQNPPAQPAVPSETRYDLAFSMLIDPRAAGGPAVQAWNLEVTTPDGEKQVFPLKAGDNILGRSDDCDVVLPDPEKWLSRRHATLTISADGVQLKDNGTVNGTFVADQRIESSAIGAGTSFRVGPKLEMRLIRR
jgi:pSer/pThr/pTyr-binding forkhead associated (FHA) protein